MAYTPTVWVTGDTITAEKLNKAEEGIEANSKLVYVAKAVVSEGSDTPVITQGDFDDACDFIDAGGIVTLTVVSEGVATLQYISCEHTSDAIRLYKATSTGGAELSLIGVEWTEDGLAGWPPA